MLFRDIFLSFLGIGVFGIGIYFATKSKGEYGWVGALAALLGGIVFLVAFYAIISMLWSHWTLD
jgi:hypothetical protein